MYQHAGTADIASARLQQSIVSHLNAPPLLFFFFLQLQGEGTCQWCQEKKELWSNMIKNRLAYMISLLTVGALAACKALYGNSSKIFSSDQSLEQIDKCLNKNKGHAAWIHAVPERLTDSFDHNLTFYIGFNVLKVWWRTEKEISHNVFTVAFANVANSLWKALSPQTVSVTLYIVVLFIKLWIKMLSICITSSFYAITMASNVGKWDLSYSSKWPPPARSKFQEK